MSKRSNGDNSQSKSKSKVVCAQAVNTQTQGKTIFDLSDDSIEKIISYLRTDDDLLNIAEADHRFETFAAKAYKETHVSIFYVTAPNEKQFRIIRYFGNFITSAIFDVNLFDFDIRILTEMKIRCRESLVSLNMRFNRTSSSTKAIPGKEQWCQFLQSIGQNFTNLNFFQFRFDIVDEVRDIRRIIQPLQSISTLAVSVNDIESMQRLISINRHLRSLTLMFCGEKLTPNFVDYMSDSLPGLINLSVEDFKVHHADFNVQPNRRVIFNNLASLDIRPLKRMEINVFDIFPIRQNRLVYLFYICKTGYTDSFINKVCQHRNLQQLFIGNISDEQLLTLAHRSHRLRNIMVYSRILTPLGVSTFLNSCPRLRFMWIGDPTSRDLRRSLVDNLTGSRWKMEINGNGLQFSWNHDSS